MTRALLSAGAALCLSALPPAAHACQIRGEEADLQVKVAADPHHHFGLKLLGLPATVQVADGEVKAQTAPVSVGGRLSFQAATAVSDLVPQIARSLVLLAHFS
jgi:hypothetical protein